MTEATSNSLDTRVLLLASDAAPIERALHKAGLPVACCADAGALLKECDRGAAAVIIGDTSLSDEARAGLTHWHEQQPVWSALALVLIASADIDTTRLPNAIVLKRPVDEQTLVSTIKAALRSRARQYEARRQGETLRRIEESEARYRALFDSAVQLSGMVDPQGRVLIANQSAVGAIGVTLDDVLGEPLWAAPWFSGTPHEAERLKSEIPRAAAGELVHYEITLLFPDGLHHVFDFSMKPVRDTVGVISQIVVEGRDISEIKRTQEALFQAQKMDVLGQITGGVAHDFNNLLMAVLANLDLLSKHSSGDPRAERLIQGAMQGARRGATLTQRLLAFARKQELNAEAVDLVMLVEGMKDLLARSVGPMVQITVDAKPKLPAAHVDPHQLELAVLNLAVNARDAMPEGGAVTISIDCVTVAEIVTNDLEPGKYLRLLVADTGIGMDATTLERAIEPFFSTKERGKGTGLGLSMAHGLAVQSGGTFRLSSSVGKGTTAEIWLPVSNERPIATVRATAPAQRSEQLRVLVVDDDALIAMSTADMLQHLGHEVIEAYSGQKALDILSNGHDVQLLITDYAMPGMTGLQLVQQARKLKPNLPILLATGYAELPDGASLDVPRLAKPFMQDQLASQIAKVFGH